MSKGLLNSMVLKNLFEDVDGAELLPALIESGVITKEQVEEYCKENIKSQKAPKPTYSLIEDGVLIKFDERDLDENGTYITPNGVRVIGDYAFANCCKLKQIHLSNDVLEIGIKAFLECGNLEHVVMTDSVRKIGAYAFIFCKSLSTIQLSDNLTQIPEHVFMDCENLELVKLPSKLETIDRYAFGYCDQLSQISLPPKTLKYVHEDAFANTPIGKDFMAKFIQMQNEQAQQKQEMGNIK